MKSSTLSVIKGGREAASNANADGKVVCIRIDPDASRAEVARAITAHPGTVYYACVNLDRYGGAPLELVLREMRDKGGKRCSGILIEASSWPGTIGLYRFKESKNVRPFKVALYCTSALHTRAGGTDESLLGTLREYLGCVDQVAFAPDVAAPGMPERFGIEVCSFVIVE